MNQFGGSVQEEAIGTDFFDDPHKYYRRWRKNGPVFRVRRPNGLPHWLITGYDEARTALADPRMRKNVTDLYEILRRAAPDGRGAGASELLSSHMLNSDAPVHTRLRKLVGREFTGRRVAALRPRIEQITEGLLDRMDGQDEVDLIEALAAPLPVMVICELLGVPFDDREKFQEWSRILLDADPSVDMAAVSQQMSDYLAALLQAKRAEPGDDLLSGLIADSEDGDQLSPDELIAMAFLLLVAGHETALHLIGNGVYLMLRDREALEGLRAHPDRIPAATEEVLRRFGPVGWATMRYTGEAVSLGGVTIPAGELVCVSLDAANHDPAYNDEPPRLHEVDESPKHLAFGHGIHFCLGAPLGRLEANVAFAQLLQRFPGLRLADPEFFPDWRIGFMRGFGSLPVRLK
ncbi:cytochrome P450 [Streptomyces kaniharaensis]|uniref:Cytochrome P450 n=1 Tax=Streptomyces kaniharaensis TaxID=212423 RepID=A0A6N7KQG0_9ACTN|nr:cytochrome P450 [Streptomyces kaniharaensis]MQS13786.1 cytochrome P450 [Streptomyces kaniharaensis]